MANIGKRKAFSIRAEKHGVNDFSQNEIEHFEYCDDDVITSGEVSEEDIVAIVNEENNSIVGSSSNMEEEQDELWLSIADAKTRTSVERRHHLQSVCLQDVVLVDQTDDNRLGLSLVIILEAKTLQMMTSFNRSPTVDETATQRILYSWNWGADKTMG
ncbi:hypothetical protein AVEN_100141-1 [Araneus ventricosus]|uniref:Uncharacterized protein n=1 Tax=Araneus ventricosus TaxID=182803 RepID=A0A4Y2VTL4_ARAVE|nr:hypothetical protein AVEN_100141-1 [Araneus ventricosus]